MTASVSIAWRNCSRSISSIIGPSSGADLAHHRLGTLGDVQFGRTGLRYRRQRRVAHHLGRTGQTLGQHPHDHDDLVGIEPQLDEPLRMRGGLGVGPQVNGGVRIVNPRQTDGPLHALQQFEVDARLFTDFARRNVNAVVTESRREASSIGRERIADLLDGEAPLEQPRDQFGAFGTRFALESVEQSGGFDVDVFGHRLNVRRGPHGSPGPTTMASNVVMSSG